MKSKPADILSVWSVLEILSPRTFKSPHDLIGCNKEDIKKLDYECQNWQVRGKTKDPYTSIFNFVLLGELRLRPIYTDLLGLFDEGNHNFNTPIADKGVLGLIILDEEGRLVDGNSIVLSSFACSYRLVLDGKLKEIVDWPEREQKLQAEILKILTSYSEEDQNKPSLTMDKIAKAYEYLVKTTGIRPGDSDPPFRLLKKTQRKTKITPEPPLLNSFYLDDLMLAKELISKQNTGYSLDLFLGKKRPKNRVDLLKSQENLQSILSPSNFPLGRWPTPGGHSLVLLQQAIVNLSFQHLKEEGILAVNGPPGTGKTTLLRDTIAGLLVKRATAMIAFKDPETAFELKSKLQVGTGITINLFEIDKTISGYEMLVASSNNKAVENISKELPDKSSISNDYADLNYFRTVSNALSEENLDTWGLISSVLGNAGNRYLFRNAFWFDDNISFKTYLRTAKGETVTVDGTDPVTGETIKITPKIIEECTPPSNKFEALNQWREAVKKFKKATDNIELKAKILEEAQSVLKTIDDLKKDHGLATESVEEIEAKEKQQNLVFEKTELLISQINKEVNAINQKKNELNINEKPNLFARLLNLQSWKDFQVKMLGVNGELQNISVRLDPLQKKQLSYFGMISELEAERSTISKKLTTLSKKIAEAESAITAAKHISGRTLADAEFWTQRYEDLHKSTIWMGQEIQKERDAVFAAALTVHKFFIGAAAKPIYSNLAALMNVFMGASLDEKDRNLLKDLWGTLFLISPVISTTFASIGKMFQNLPPESIGWLFVDEAGQATPQSGVGALLRCRRAIVLGDPMQIEPVVSLPENLTRALCKEFDVNMDIWASPSSSIQTCSDLASMYGTELSRGGGDSWIGAPLVTHRRCANPMFDISNSAAYENIMVHATNDRPSEILNILGQSCWYDVAGKSVEKWCHAEGLFVLSIIDKLLINGIKDPDIYIISPFRTVAHQMRKLMLDSPIIKKMSGKDTSWVNDRIGTVHTFQGKEAEAVIFLLGAQGDEEKGARGWAGARANLLNVAVTRAKSGLYVVGNRELWKSNGFFKLLGSGLRCRDLNESTKKAVNF